MLNTQDRAVIRACDLLTPAEPHAARNSQASLWNRRCSSGVTHYCFPWTNCEIKPSTALISAGSSTAQPWAEKWSFRFFVCNCHKIPEIQRKLFQGRLLISNLTLTKCPELLISCHFTGISYTGFHEIQYSHYLEAPQLGPAVNPSQQWIQSSRGSTTQGPDSYLPGLKDSSALLFQGLAKLTLEPLPLPSKEWMHICKVSTSHLSNLVYLKGTAAKLQEERELVPDARCALNIGF